VLRSRPPQEGGHGGDDNDGDDGSGNPDHEHRGTPWRPTPEHDFFGSRDSDDDGSVDSKYNRCHPGIDYRTQTAGPGGDAVTVGMSADAGGAWARSPRPKAPLGLGSRPALQARELMMGKVAWRPATPGGIYPTAPSVG